MFKFLSSGNYEQISKFIIDAMQTIFKIEFKVKLIFIFLCFCFVFLIRPGQLDYWGVGEGKFVLAGRYQFLFHKRFGKFKFVFMNLLLFFIQFCKFCLYIFFLDICI